MHTPKAQPRPCSGLTCESGFPIPPAVAEILTGEVEVGVNSAELSEEADPIDGPVRDASRASGGTDASPTHVHHPERALDLLTNAVTRDQSEYSA